MGSNPALPLRAFFASFINGCALDNGDRTGTTVESGSGDPLLCASPDGCIGGEPSTYLDDIPDDPTHQTSASFVFGSDEPAARFECDLDGSDWVWCDATYPITTWVYYAGPLIDGTHDGTHSFAVRAMDLAGTRDPTPATWTWTVDVTDPPPPTLTCPGAGTTIGDTSPHLTGRAEPFATVRIDLTGGGPTDQRIG